MMSCYHPVNGFRGYNGKLVKRRAQAVIPLEELTVPCGGCIGCRTDYVRQWAVRCYHEASLYDRNCFLTLTYNDESLPPDWNVNKVHFQKFVRRARKAGFVFRYFHCGEYGDLNGRPHYHACIFGEDFSKDRAFFRMSNGYKIYVSPTLTKLWSLGHAYIGSLTLESAAYVARYVMKKARGSNLVPIHVDTDSGEVWERVKEYVTMSLKPGIGQGWLEKYSDEVYRGDFLVIDGKKIPPPRYYDKKFEEDNEARLMFIKEERERKAKVFEEHSSPERLKVREEIHRKKIEIYSREYA